MKSGYEMRKVINQLNGFDFNNSDDRHIFGTVYESILLELRDAGNKGEFYTPRAITRLMTQMTAPRLGEKVLDPAAGTAGFLSAAIDFIRDKEVHTLDDEAILQKSITGWELKPVSYVLGLTNLILHGLDVPDWHYLDSLKTEYNSIGPRQQVDVILANPPFGASIADGVETNFPQSFRCRESADLFIVLFIQMLKPGGRCAIVLPDGCITGDGYKERIREKLLTDCNLHTIVRLPQSTFHPATVSTNLLFFEKGTETKEIWYYEHSLPDGQKSYSKTKAIQFDEFAPMIEWWDNREESEIAWKVKVEDLKRGFDLDVKNPNSAEQDSRCPLTASSGFDESLQKTKHALSSLVKVLEPVGSQLQLLANNPSAFFFDPKTVSLLRSHILSFAIDGKLTTEWRAAHPDVEPTSQFLHRIQAEKARLIAAKKLRPEKPLPKITPAEIPFEIPKGWEWCRLGDIAMDTSYGTSQKAHLEAKGIPVLRMGNITSDGTISYSGLKYVSPTIKDLPGLYLEPGDIAFNRTNSFELVGKSAVFRRDTPFTLASYLIRVRLFPSLTPEFVAYFINSTTCRLAFIEPNVIQQNGQANFNGTKLKNIPVPLPPLAEQTAIMERVESLMQHCRSLSAEIEHTRTHAAHPLQAVLKEAFAPAAQ